MSFKSYHISYLVLDLLLMSSVVTRSIGMVSFVPASNNRLYFEVMIFLILRSLMMKFMSYDNNSEGLILKLKQL